MKTRIKREIEAFDLGIVGSREKFNLVEGCILGALIGMMIGLAITYLNVI